MIWVLLVVLALIAGAAYLVLTFVVKGKQSQGTDEVRETLGADNILVLDDKAICKGTESGRYNNLVGMGTLALTKDEFYFLRWSPRAELRIPRSDMLEHTFTIEHLDKGGKKPWLQVRYRNPEYTEGDEAGVDVVAWDVDDPDAFNDALKAQA